MLEKGVKMRYLHTMIRISDIKQSLAFFCDGLGLELISQKDYESGRYTLIFLAGKDDKAAAKSHHAPMVELTYNWDQEAYQGGRNFGHLAFEVDDIYATCTHIEKMGIVINRPPRDGHMAFVRSPDGISIELLQKNGSLELKEPWISTKNVGAW